MAAASLIDHAYVLMPDGDWLTIVTGSTLRFDDDGTLTILPPELRLEFQDGEMVEQPVAFMPRTYKPGGAVVVSHPQGGRA